MSRCRSVLSPWWLRRGLVLDKDGRIDIGLWAMAHYVDLVHVISNRFCRSFRVTDAHDRTPRINFGFYKVLTELTSRSFGFSHFGFGSGFLGSVVRSSVNMPTPN